MRTEGAGAGDGRVIWAEGWGSERAAPVTAAVKRLFTAAVVVVVAAL